MTSHSYKFTILIVFLSYESNEPKVFISGFIQPEEEHYSIFEKKCLFWSLGRHSWYSGSAYSPDPRFMNLETIDRARAAEDGEMKCGTRDGAERTTTQDGRRPGAASAFVAVLLRLGQLSAAA